MKYPYLITSNTSKIDTNPKISKRKRNVPYLFNDKNNKDVKCNIVNEKVIQWLINRQLI